MSNSIAKTSCLSTRSFKLLKDSMLQAEGLPLAEVLDDNDWQKVFDKHEIDFGHDEDTVYTPAITLWALISQAFFKAEMRGALGNAWQDGLRHQQRGLLSREFED